MNSCGSFNEKIPLFVFAQYLPIYTPSEEEKRDPALFASNVRHIMAKSVSTSSLMIQNVLVLNVCCIWSKAILYACVFFRALQLPTLDYTFEDCQLSMVKGPLCLPSHTCLLEFSRLMRKLGWVSLKTLERLSACFMQRWCLAGFHKHYEVLSEQMDVVQRLSSLWSAHGSCVKSADEHTTWPSLWLVVTRRVCTSPFIPSIKAFISLFLIINLEPNKQFFLYLCLFCHLFNVQRL